VPLLVTVGVLAAGLGLELTGGPGRVVNPFLPVIAGTALLYGVLGHLVAGRHAGHPIARLLQLAGLLGVTVVLAGGHANAALFGPLPGSGAAVTLWISRWLWIPTTAAASLGLLLLFPDGRLPSPRWRPAALVAALGGPCCSRRRRVRRAGGVGGLATRADSPRRGGGTRPRRGCGLNRCAVGAPTAERSVR
jgi:hypothetical protein